MHLRQSAEFLHRIMLSDKDMLNRMARGWRGGKGDGTICGNGSTFKSTENVRKWLPEIAERYDIKTVCDAGAGDLHWIHKVNWEVEYSPFDLIPRTPEVERLDVTTELLPSCDAVLCRMVLNHLWGDDGDATRVEMALENFAKVST